MLKRCLPMAWLVALVCAMAGALPAQASASPAAEATDRPVPARRRLHLRGGRADGGGAGARGRARLPGRVRRLSAVRPPWSDCRHTSVMRAAWAAAGAQSRIRRIRGRHPRRAPRATRARRRGSDLLAGRRHAGVSCAHRGCRPSTWSSSRPIAGTCAKLRPRYTRAWFQILALRALRRWRLPRSRQCGAGRAAIR